MRIVTLGCFTCTVTSRNDLTANATKKLSADVVHFVVSETLGEKSFVSISKLILQRDSESLKVNPNFR